jgi:hypothetical protein
MRRLAVVMMTTVLIGGIAHAQTPEERIETALANAAESRIPVALLEDVVMEGQAKGAALDRIAQAVERRLAALARASEALAGQPAVAPADLAAVADAHEAGISDTILAAVFAKAPGERRAVAVEALTRLVEDGQVPPAALEQVIKALEQGPGSGLNLPAAAAGVASGAPAGVTAGPPAGVPAPGVPSEAGRPAGLPVP